MAFQVSPGVLVVEKDLTNIIPSVASSIGAFVGNFAWGPAEQPVTVASELDLVQRFGKPNAVNFQSFFSAANFLAYSGNLVLVRQVGSVARNATADGTGLLIKNETVWDNQYRDGSGSVGLFAAKYAGALGNSLKVSMADSGGVRRTLTGTLDTNLSGPNLTAEITGTTTEFTTEVVVGDSLYTSAGVLIGVVGEIVDDTTLNLTAAATVTLSDAANVVAEWQFIDEFDAEPGTSDWTANKAGSNDELHVVVIDEDGLVTGTPGTLLEKFAGLSKAFDAMTSQGATNYYKNVLAGSQFVWWMDHQTTNLEVSGSAWGGSSEGTTFKSQTLPVSVSLAGGVSESSLTSGEVRAGYDLLSDVETIDINLVIMGHHGLSDAKYVIENIAESRKDCVVFCSPSLASVVNNPGQEADDILAERTGTSFNVNSSYGFLDTGWKKQYDKYNDLYRYIPLNADCAGLAARTDLTNDPWWSPAGLNRGQIKNVVSLAYNPRKTDRDRLFQKGINPVVSFPGEGTVLYGDKTLLTKPSAFDALNVRRLFIVLEKAIATAARYQLFEFNDAFTRAQFRNMVEPFLRDVQGRRGLTDFRVVCDETNNTPEVIDRNEFIGSVFLKPARAIRGITLNFVAVRTGVSFEEIVGA